ncbi:Lrp/AsnC ligand binding domain-containing protein [Methanocella arvoryzae]|uniref:Lrp/AsnC ligand binding domain-containing protein n=1 Tax=Methanocella arvoryzae TaxID=1175445 RepID=UPI000324E5FB|nr:Lrp/AsnC ligand binding domain-containing protein [Methanocella arvoryzae]
MYTSFIGLCIDLDREDRLTEALIGMDGVAEVYTMMQPFDLFVKVRAENLKKLESTVQEILNLDGVQRSYNFLTVQQKKG